MIISLKYKTNSSSIVFTLSDNNMLLDCDHTAIDDLVWWEISSDKDIQLNMEKAMNNSRMLNLKRPPMIR